MYPTGVASALGIMAAIVLTVLLYILVMPKKKDGTFSNSFIQFLHDFFHFKKLYVEEVLRFFYVLATLFCICFGFFSLFGYIDAYYYSQSTFAYGLGILIGGPVVLRVFYELIMMAILLIKNVIEINNKLPAKADAHEKKPVAPVVPAPRVAPVAPVAPAAPVAPEAQAENTN